MADIETGIFQIIYGSCLTSRTEGCGLQNQAAGICIRNAGSCFLKCLRCNLYRLTPCFVRRNAAIDFILSGSKALCPVISAVNLDTTDTDGRIIGV